MHVLRLYMEYMYKNMRLYPTFNVTIKFILHMHIYYRFQIKIQKSGNYFFNKGPLELHSLVKLFRPKLSDTKKCRKRHL